MEFRDPEKTLRAAVHGNDASECNDGGGYQFSALNPLVLSAVTTDSGHVHCYRIGRVRREYPFHPICMMYIVYIIIMCVCIFVQRVKDFEK